MSAMWDLIGAVLGGMLAIIAMGAVLVGYVLWSRKRRQDAALQDAAAEAARRSSGGKGEE